MKTILKKRRKGMVVFLFCWIFFGIANTAHARISKSWYKLNTNWHILPDHATDNDFPIPTGPDFMRLGDLIAGRHYMLFNEDIREWLAYGEEEYGINLRWTTNSDSLFGISFEAQGIRNGQVIPAKLVARTSSLEGIYQTFGAGPHFDRKFYYDNVAIHVEGGGYLCYGERGYGINLVWSNSPCYEWVLLQKFIDGGSFGLLGSGLHPGADADVVLYNRRGGGAIKYGNREYGIHLVWDK